MRFRPGAANVHTGGDSMDALTGVGVCLPMITMIIAFANLVGMGGAPLFSIERGKKNECGGRGNPWQLRGAVSDFCSDTDHCRTGVSAAASAASGSQ